MAHRFSGPFLQLDGHPRIDGLLSGCLICRTRSCDITDCSRKLLASNSYEFLNNIRNVALKRPYCR
jgi:hypothetical protein